MFAPQTASLTVAVKSYYELAFNFINKNYSKDDNIPKADIINTIKEVLNNGATYQVIDYKIQNCHCSDKDYKRFFKTISSAGGANIIDIDRFYYHNELRVFPEPPTVHFDINTGEMKKVDFEYFLEMKASYTLNELLEYITSKYTFSLFKINMSRALGGLKTLLCKYDLEHIMFTVDTVDTIYSSKNNKRVKNIFEIEDYMEEGKTNLNMKITESVVNNTNTIVFKKRKLFEEM